jgi:hypothetical protein
VLFHGAYAFVNIIQPSEEPHTVAEDRVTEEDHSGNESQVGESEIQGEESTEISKIVDEQTVHEVCSNP